MTKAKKDMAVDESGLPKLKNTKDFVVNNEMVKEMREILDWFPTIWARTPPSDKVVDGIRKKYFSCLNKYKRKEIQRLHQAEAKKQIWRERQMKAIMALPPRLRYTALCDIDERWIERQIPEPVDRPLAYDIDNFRTWPPYVKSLFEYNFTPGTEIPLQRVHKSLYGQEGIEEKSFEDDDLNFKLEGTRIQTAEKNLKEWWSLEEMRKHFGVTVVKKVKNQGGKKKSDGPKKVKSKYPEVSKVLDDPDTQEKIVAELDDYMTELTPAQRTELIQGLLRMELSKETTKLKKSEADASLKEKVRNGQTS